ncbi:glycosyltransferase [Gemmata sp. JC673]|uniref:Glycosyltransferase n=1 Tax=Gemmata algarum TaxID=2975278 RepID=A0ABU5ERG6_9BACT|nr:glycosyltransferase [Gemmata algarum]MDY3557931.1 glycosyltransferase [Gemmata algarum]
MVATIAAWGCLVPATLACLGYLVPALAGLRRRSFVPRRRPTRTFTVLVPAHNEEDTLPRTLRSLAALQYPPELVRVLVVADNCTDQTANVARAFGAECSERAEPDRRGKGFALAFGLEHALRHAPDAVLVLDADCEMSTDALGALDAAFAAGAEAVQAAVQSANADDGPGGFVAAVGAAFDALTAAGWDALGFSVPLRGTGMAFGRGLLERIPWTAFSAVEDAEYAARLRRAGVRVRYCAEAQVSCEAPAGVAELCRQRRRWSGAGLLASKPLVLGYIVAAVAVGALCGYLAWPAALLTTLGLLYLRAVWAVGVTRTRAGLLLRAPGVVARLGFVTLGAAFRRPPTWDRSHRPDGGRRAA